MTNTSTASPQCRFAVGDAVEVQVRDFRAPGMPQVWVATTVQRVRAIDGTTPSGLPLFNVIVEVDGAPHAVTVGPRASKRASLRAA